MLRAAVGFAARGVYISDMMLHLLISLVAASAANETSIAYYESPSMVSAPQGLRFSMITGSASALVSASEQAPRAPRLYAVLSWRSRERGAVGSPLAGASRVKGGACGCRSPEEWSVAEFLGGRTSGALTLRRARAAQSAVCTRVRAGTPTALSPVPPTTPVTTGYAVC